MPSTPCTLKELGALAAWGGKTFGGAVLGHKTLGRRQEF